jgi:pimeloyl-ACP methyl ester carboxylesterase
VQVDLLISFCSEMGLRSVVLVGHDDGGLLALKTAEKLRTYGDHRKVNISFVHMCFCFLWKFVLHVIIRCYLFVG